MNKSFIQNKLNGGYIGLISLLIGVVIIAFIIAKTDIFTGQKNGKNTIEQGREVIDQANNAKNIIEQYSRRAIEQ